MKAKQTMKNFEKIFLELYKQGKSTTEICSELGVNRNKGYKLLQKLGLHSHIPPRSISSKQIEEIVQKYLLGQTIQEISKELKIKKGTVNYWLRKKGITRPNGKVPALNQDYFENIDTPSKAYFLGLFFADGGFMKSKRKNGKYNLTISLELKVEDGYIIEEFKKEINCENDIGDDERDQYRKVNGKEYYYHKHNKYLRFGSVKMVEDLKKWGCTENKTKELFCVPDIPPNLLRYFLLGFYDGDGIASVGQRSYMGFCGTESFMKSVAENLNQLINLPLKKPFFNQFNKIYYLQYNRKEEIEKLYHFFYDNLNIPCLIRKKDKIFNCLYANTEVT